MDFLGGRGYNQLGIDFSVIFTGKRDRLTGNFASVLWANDAVPILLAREQTGLPLLYADLPDARQANASWTFQCAAYGNQILAAVIEELKPMPGDALAKLEGDFNRRPWIGWKYIPSVEGLASDVSYPTQVFLEHHLAKGWSGAGSLELRNLPPPGIPGVSSLVLDQLRKLPIIEYTSGGVLEGSMDMLPLQTRKLE